MFQSALIFCLLGVTPQSSEAGTVQETLKVVFRDIRLHVTDKKGKPVTGLKPSDFIVKESGISHEITFFEEVSPPAPEEPVDTSQLSDDAFFDDSKTIRNFNSDRYLVILIDSANMRQDAHPEFMEVINRFIDEQVTDRDLVQIVELEDRVIPLSPFLRSKDLMRQAVAKTNYKGHLFQRLRTAESEVVRTFAGYVDPTLGRQGFGTAPSDPFGGAQTNPADPLESDRRFWLEELRNAVREKELLKLNHYRSYHYGIKRIAQTLNQVTGDKAIFHFTGGGYLTSRGFFKTTFSMAEELSRELNSANVTLYSYVHVPAQAVGLASRRTSRVDLESELNPITELGSTQMLAQSVVLEEAFKVTDLPRNATENTGGILTTANSINAIGTTFDDFVAGTKHYYRIGYTMEAPKKRSKLKISFREKRKGLKLAYGREFDPVKSFIDMKKEEQSVAFLSALQFATSFRNDLGCDWGYAGFPGSDTAAQTISVYAQLNAENFPAKGYQIGFATLNDQRDLTDKVTSTIMDKSDKANFLFYDVLLPKAKPAFVRFLVINLDNGQQSVFEMPYKTNNDGSASDFSITQMHLASLRDDLKMIPINHFRFANSGEKAREPNVGMRKFLDPFGMGNYVFRPEPEQSFTPAKEWAMFFQISNPSASLDQYGWECTLSHQGKVIPINLKVTDVHKLTNNAYNVVGTLSTEPLPPGQYELKMSIKGQKNDQAADLSHPFIVSN